jgi:hypothetical protein
LAASNAAASTCLKQARTICKSVQVHVKPALADRSAETLNSGWADQNSCGNFFRRVLASFFSNRGK